MGRERGGWEVGGSGFAFLNFTTMPDEREIQLGAWLRESFAAATLRPLAGDASFRRYFRATVGDGKTFVAMDAPPPNESVSQFVSVGEFAGTRMSTPKVFATDPERGFALLEDFGDVDYATALADGGDAESLYADAVSAMVRLQLPPLPDWPRYDERLLRRETGLFGEWYCKRARGEELQGAARREVSRAESFVVAEMSRQALCAVHRDYHSRNLMALCGERNPGALDFQDAVVGPATYDLASLARDAYVPPDPERERMLLEMYWRVARENGLQPASSADALRRDFNIVSAQRGLKVAGIFCRLAIRDGKRGYLHNIPNAHANAVAACGEVPELRGLGKVLSDFPPPEVSSTGLGESGESGEQ